MNGVTISAELNISSQERDFFTDYAVFVNIVQRGAGGGKPMLKIDTYFVKAF